MERHARRLSRRRALALAAAVSLAAAAAWADAPPKVGEPAPEFALSDSNGRPVALSAFRGKTVVLEWTNAECPFVRKHYVTGNMQGLQRQARSDGMVWLTLSSMAPGKMGYVDGLEANAWVDQNKADPAAFLMDPDGKVAELFAVQVALTLFVIGPNGRLVYSGAIDDKPTARPQDVSVARNYVREAMSAAARGVPMQPAATRAYGCNGR